ncbi:MAG TPA: glycerophosphodiester phosphodiesterase family protein [Nocardioides sp.]|jgi:glycerophosphoryl diester phosphodiesterase|nr:glycerophosphodiester phosphodiesterase family protein [Nocardioides sp.]
MHTGFPFLDDGAPVLAFAHRGGARHPGLEGLENTRAAFAHAVALGYTYLETDVHVTRDGVLVAFHDALLERVTDGAGSVEAYDWPALAEVRVAGREPVPTLVSLVESFPDARFNIDVKTDAAVAPLAALVHEHRLHGRVLVGSFSGRRIRRFRRLAGRRVATAASPGEVAAYVTLPAGLARQLTRAAPAALQIPHRRGRIVVASPRVVRRAHAAGLPVHVWTVDDAAEMAALLDRGVDGLMTDRTDILREVLRRRGVWNADQERSDG